MAWLSASAHLSAPVLAALLVACSSTLLTAPTKRNSAADSQPDGDAGTDVDLDAGTPDAGDGGADGDAEGGTDTDGDVDGGIDSDDSAAVGLDGLLGSDSDSALSGTKPIMAISKHVPCISCHAIIRGDLLTDFGMNDAPMAGLTYHQAFAAIRSKNLGPNTQDGLESMNLRGSLIIPKVKGSNSQAAGSGVSFNAHYEQAGTTVGADFSLYDALTKPRRRYQESEAAIKPETMQVLPVVDPNRAAAAAGVDAIKEVAKLVIHPPTPAAVRAIVEDDKAVLVEEDDGVKIVRWSDAAADGIQIVTSGGATYALATGSPVCKGDVAIDGMLVVKDVDFESNKRGCRLYASRTIFVVGSATASGSDQATLQLASGVGIVFGMKYEGGRGLGLSNFNSQELEDDRTAMEATDVLVEAGPYAQLLVGSDVVATSFDALRVLDTRAPAGHQFGAWTPVPGKTIPGACANAVQSNPGTGCLVGWTQVNRQTETYSGLVLVAPIVHSRYHGLVKGMILADTALFALNKLEFEYDDRLTKAVLVPRLKGPLLEYVK